MRTRGFTTKQESQKRDSYFSSANARREQTLSSGFTLIELLVVIAIIGVLSSVVLASLNTARGKARDAKRLADLHEIQLAIEMYYNTCGTYVVRQNCTGTAYGSSGIGWFDYPGYSGSAGSVAQGLVSAGVMSSVAIDPSGITTSNGSTQSGYMINAGSNYYTIWANLESPTPAQQATQNTCSSSGYDNYSTTYPAAAQMNYCVSNQ